METRQLTARIATLRGQVRRLLALHGLGWLVGMLVPLVALAALADWLFHLDGLTRAAALAALGLLGLWLVARLIVLPLIVRFDDLDIALRIEERWPGLNDRLSSTVQFLDVSEDDDRYGSRELREATVRRTLDETRGIDFREVVESRPARRALGVALVALMLAVGLAAADPSSARLALRRLFLPFGNDRWPQSTHLTLLDKETPRKVAKGDPFTLAVAVAAGDRMPTSAKATYRFDDGETTTEALRIVEGGFRGRLESVDRPFRFSVAAGDDATSIRDVPVSVVPPPALDEITVKLTPPAYTKLPAQTLAPGKTQLRAVEGTSVEVQALANKPIAKAGLRLSEKTVNDQVRIDPAGTRLSVGFVLAESTPFWFELLDTEGFRSREATRYELRAFKDEVPRVTVDEPSNDRDVPAHAIVPVTFTADDDFGIHSARLIYKTATGGSEPTSEVVLPLFDGTDAAVPVRHKEISHTWDLAPLKLTPGSIITFHADARDFDTVRGPKLGKSRDLRLRIVSDEDVARQMDDAQRAIREDIEGILAMQNQAITPVEEALRSLSRAGDVSRPGRENLKNAGTTQRQVASRVTNKTDGLDQKIARFLQDSDHFKVDNPEARNQMQAMRSAVKTIRDKHLEPAEQGLTRASKSLDSQPNDPSAPTAKDEPAGEERPAQAGNEPTKASRPTPGGKAATAKPPSGERPADPGKAATPESRTGAASAESKGSSKSSPSESSRAGEAKKGQEAGEKADDDAKQADVPKSMELAKNSLDEAKQNQKEIADQLKKMLDGLSEFETYRGVVKDAQNLLKEHEQAMKQTAEVADKPDLDGKTPDQLTPGQKADLGNLAAKQASVGKNLQGLKEKMEQMAGRLDPSDPLAASALREAAEQIGKKGTGSKIGDAAEQLEKNQMGSARSSQEQARDDLKNLLDSVQNRRERELARLVKELKAAESDLAKLRQRQTENLRKTRDASKIKDPKARANELKRLAKEQAEIQKQLDRQLKRLTKLNADTAAQAGARSASKMGQASKDLDEDQGEQAEKDQDDALADLEDAEDQVKQARKEAEEQLAMEQLAKMGDHLKSLAERQQKLVTDIEGYEKLRKEREGKLTIAQRTGVRDLAGVEEGMKDETAELAEKLEGAPVFSLTLKRATDGMTTAADGLQNIKTDEPTLRAAKSAASRFQQLIDALKPDKPKEGGQQQGGGGGGGGGGSGDGIPPAAQIKMLRALQQEINERTEYYDELRRRSKALTPSQTTELDKLQEDQGTLADLVRDLTRPKKDDAEE